MVRKGIWWNRTWISELKNLSLGGWWAAHEKLPTETEESLNLTGHSPGQPEQITVLSYFQRIHSTSPTPWFCVLNHPSFYLYKLGLPFFGADPCFPLDLCPTAAHSPGDCRWLCRWLCRGLAEAYLTGCPAACFPVFSQDAHQGSIQFPMRGYPTGGTPFSCVDPGEMPLST